MKATYTYLADGTKIKAVNASGWGSDYIGSFKYNRNGSNILLESVATAGGRTYKTSGGYEARYFVTDHLGSTRLIAYPNGNVIEQNDYMPYGERHSNSSLATSGNPFLYNGKELQKSFGINYIDSEARFQRLDGAFNSIDPLCEKYYHISPYTYCAANPIKYIDYDGKKIYFAQGTTKEFKKKFAATIKYMNSRGTAGDIAKIESNKDEIFYISEGKSSQFNSSSNTIYWNPAQVILTDNNKVLFPATILAHEFGHAIQKMEKTSEEFNNGNIVDKNNPYEKLLEEEIITTTEQFAARKHGDISDDEVTRTNHNGKSFNISGIPNGVILDDEDKVNRLNKFIQKLLSRCVTE